VEILNDELRRQARATQDAHAAAMRPFRNALNRVFGERGATADAKRHLMLPGLDRRGFLRIGGVTIAGAAILAACGGDDDDSTGATSAAAGASSPTSASGSNAQDATILRTASSIEALAVAAYQKGIDSGLVTTPAVADAAKLFQSQHQEHLDYFVSLTEKAGGQAFRDPNPAILEQLQPTIAALSDEQGVVQLAHDLEVAAAETYQSNVAMFKDATLNVAIMSVGGVEARHVAVLATVLATPPVPAAFQVRDKAVPSGTGLK
jgi:nitroreductase